VKLVHLVGFIIKKFVTMQHGHTNVKNRTHYYNENRKSPNRKLSDTNYIKQWSSGSDTTWNSV